MLQGKGQEFVCCMHGLALLSGLSKITLTLMLFLSGCFFIPKGINPPPKVTEVDANPSPMVTPTEASPTDTVPAPSEELSSTESTPDVIYHNATIITMDPDQPQAQAIAIKGDMILAVGSNRQVKSIAGPETRLVDLGRAVIVPGFIDSHGHWIGDNERFGDRSIDETLQYLIENGWTSINEMFVSQERLDELLKLDEEDRLPVRVNAYLPVNYLDQRFGRPYLQYTPLEILSPHVRVAGVKFFTDNDWGHIINWDQEELNTEIQTAHRAGWQVAIHTFSVQGHAMVLEALRLALNGEDNSAYRHRIEHVIAITDDQLQEIQEQEYIASVQFNFPGNISWADPTFYEKIEEEDLVNYTRWNDIYQAGILIAGGSDWPWFSNQTFMEIGEAPAGSPLRLIYKAATHTGPEDQPPDEWMRQQFLPVEVSLQALTINGAYATFEEDIKGSLTPGKWADLVVLSGNPLEILIEDIVDIQVRMTMIGGEVAYCADASDPMCLTTETPSMTSFIKAVGNWKATDIDGSAMTLEITHFRGNKFNIAWYDDDASYCDPTGSEQDPLPWTAEGAGTATELTLEVLGLTGKCVDNNRQVEINYTLEYDPQADTLLDNYDVRWERE